MLVSGNRGKKAVTFLFLFFLLFPFSVVTSTKEVVFSPLFVCCKIAQKNYLTAEVKAAVSMFHHFSYLLVCFAVSTNLPPLYVTT